jgi:hypothetical protein
MLLLDRFSFGLSSGLVLAKVLAAACTPQAAEGGRPL